MANERRALMHRPLPWRPPGQGAETQTEGITQRRPLKPLKRAKTGWRPKIQCAERRNAAHEKPG